MTSTLTITDGKAIVHAFKVPMPLVYPVDILERAYGTVAEDTRNVYTRRWKQWGTWAKAHGLPQLPAEPEAVVAYLAGAWDAGGSFSLIEGHLCAIAWHAKKVYHGLGLMDPKLTKQPAVVEFMDTKRHEQLQHRPPTRQVDPITRDMLDVICEHPDVDQATAALLRTMSDALLRISEACAVQWGHLTPGRHGLGVLMVKRRKLRRKRPMQAQPLTQPTMRALAAIRPTAPEPEPDAYVWPGPKGRESHPQRLRLMIQRAVKAAGYEGRYSGHSLRVGMAQDLVRDGATIDEMQQAGGWVSRDMPAHYAERQAAERMAVARLYGENPGDKESNGG